MKQWWQHGSLWVWFSASALLCTLLLFIALISLIVGKGLQHHWPADLITFQVQTAEGGRATVMGQLIKQEPGNHYTTDNQSEIDPSLNTAQQLLIDQGDTWFMPSQGATARYIWLDDGNVLQRSKPADAIRLDMHDGRVLFGVLQSSDAEPAIVDTQQTAIDLPGEPWLLLHANGQEIQVDTGDVKRYHFPNSLNGLQKSLLFLKQWWWFLTEDPHHQSTAGGVFPAIFGTMVMVLLMSVIVTPFGVLAAIYLHEYAGKSWLTQVVRVSVYNLAGIPSVVMGLFGLAFFVYVLGGQLDQLFYADQLPAPTYGTPGLFWASLTLALLTLPVVIVATEEGLAQLPMSQRLGSYALGATQTETIWRIVAPQAAPAMMTGLILAVARAAGEVAPLMLVGVVKSAPQLPIDGEFPYVHLERQFMHLGYHLYDVGFQSANTEHAMSLSFAVALVLLMLIVLLNLSAFMLRQHLRRKYKLVQTSMEGV
ncbi:phosphate ABC transporter permease PstA [Alkalimonas collagenimarina]|uniref:Phosphate transport system permease protein PstA n=1 Tax=Alkalimonas collagenimarina TaxID=400390 RepID=A0ABT9GWL6_9GAMM|nr:phosphate ABC transporter permease PstA [Alkalimonas collagenimarina]MDP4535458.1 phosphate ABC transporter permease PstA [Alkalimonas collagenimarina]